MGRSKNKQPGGHNPLTYHERTRKFASSGYGTVSQRLAGHSQYRLGDCALSATSLLLDSNDQASAATALCSPSGYLYRESAILEYLLQRTQELKRQRLEWEQRQQQRAAEAAAAEAASQKRKVADFRASQRTVAPKKQRGGTNEDDGGGAASASATAQKELQRVSYWLAGSQPAAVNHRDKDNETKPPPPPPEPRPGSPVTGAPLRRRDLWPVRLRHLPPDGDSSGSGKQQKHKHQLVCAVSHRALSSTAAPCVAYWTKPKKQKKDSSTSTAVAVAVGEIVLRSVYDDLQMEKSRRCPLTDGRIARTRQLQRGGSSFAAAAGPNATVQKYRPTMT